MLNYYNPINSDGIIYSIDMLRVGFMVPYFKLDNFYRWLTTSDLRLGYYFDLYQSNKIGSFKYLLSCSYGKDRKEFSFTIGLDLIQPSRSCEAKCMIEFNPNKNDMFFIKDLLTYICCFLTPIEGKYYQLIRYDLAVDIPLPREQVLLLKEGKRRYQRVLDTSLTEYIGRRNSNGFVKVYDKTAESNLDYALTRVEITCDSMDCIRFPRVVLLEDIEEDMSILNDTDKVLINLFRRLDVDEQQHYLRKLGRGKRQKLEPFIFPVEKEFKFDITSVQWTFSTIIDVLQGYKYDVVELEKDILEWRLKQNEDNKQYSIFDK